MRNQIEEWYAELPAKAQPGFQSRLRTHRGFESTLSELYAHHWLRASLLADHIDPEPAVGKGNPDFVAALPDGTQLVLEVKTPGDIDEGRSALDLSSYLMDKCRHTLPPGYLVAIRLSDPLQNRGEVECLAVAIDRAVRGEAAGGCTELRIPFARRLARLDVSPTSPANPPAVIISGPAEDVTPTHDHVQDKLAREARKFRTGLAGRPLVLWVVDGTHRALGEDDWLGICYGKNRYQFALGHGDSGPQAHPLPREGGLFIRRRGTRTQATYIAAVIAGRSDIGPDGYSACMACYANPFASVPLPLVIRQLMPTWAPDPDRAGTLLRTDPTP